MDGWVEELSQGRRCHCEKEGPKVAPDRASSYSGCARDPVLPAGRLVLILFILAIFGAVLGHEAVY